MECMQNSEKKTYVQMHSNRVLLMTKLLDVIITFKLGNVLWASQEYW